MFTSFSRDCFASLATFGFVNGFKSLRTKLLFGSSVPIFVTVLISVWATYNFFRLSGATHDIMVENYNSVLAAQNMMDALERQDSAELLFLFGEKEHWLKVFTENETGFLSWYARAEDNITLPSESEIIAQIRHLQRKNSSK